LFLCISRFDFSHLSKFRSVEISKMSVVFAFGPDDSFFMQTPHGRIWSVAE
jgi:hypothetical protein